MGGTRTANNTVSSVNQSPVKKAVIMPENVPMNSMGKPKVTSISSNFLCLITLLTPSVRVHTSSIPTEEMKDRMIISIVFINEQFIPSS